MMMIKSHLVMRMIELRVGQDLLLQALNKALSLATAAASKRQEFQHWTDMLISTAGFLRTIFTVSGKDINIFVDQWMYLFLKDICTLNICYHIFTHHQILSIITHF